MAAYPCIGEINYNVNVENVAATLQRVRKHVHRKPCSWAKRMVSALSTTPGVSICAVPIRSHCCAWMQNPSDEAELSIALKK